LVIFIVEMDVDVEVVADEMVLVDMEVVVIVLRSIVVNVEM